MGATVTIVIRPTWKGDENQERFLAEAIEAAHSARVAEDEAWSKISKAREAGVPDTVICRRAEISRATMNRKLGSRPGG